MKTVVFFAIWAAFLLLWPIIFGGWGFVAAVAIVFAGVCYMAYKDPMSGMML